MSDGFPDRVTQLRSRWQADPTSRVFLQLAEEYRHLGRLRDALEVLEAGLREHPGYLSALVAQGRCLLELGEAQAAREVLERVVAQDVTQMVASKLLVRAYLELGDAEQARQRLDLYCLLNDGDPEIEDLKRRVAAMNRPSPAEEGLPPAPLDLEGGMELDEPFAVSAGAASRPGDVFDLDSSQLVSERPSSLPSPVAAVPVAAAAPAAPSPTGGAAPAVRPVIAADDGDPFPELKLSGPPRGHDERLSAEGIFAFEPRREVVFELEPEAPASPAAAALPPEIPPVGEDDRETLTGPWEVEPEPHVHAPAADAPEGSAFTVAEWAPEVEPAPPAPAFQPAEEPVFSLEPEPPAPEPAAPWAPLAAVAPITPVAPAAEAEELFEAPAADAPAPSAPPVTPVTPPTPATATLGQLYHRQGHTGEAERIFRAVLERDPANAVARAELARITGEARPLAARDLLAGAPQGSAKGKKIHLLKNYLQLVRRASRHHVP